MKISIFGLGYVGAVSAGCLAADGHQVLGVDPIADKVDLINRGHSPIVEAEIGEIIEETVRNGRLRATQDPSAAVHETDLSFVCVGTPSQSNGNLDLRYIRRICEQIGQALQNKAGRHIGRHSQHDFARNDEEGCDSYPGRVLREERPERISGFATIRNS